MATHRGHIICLYAGRAVYVPKAPTLQQTLKDAVDCFGLDRNLAVHFGFPHADLAIMVEISSYAFSNVRDGAILYLCTGSTGPVYPQELAEQARVGIASRATARLDVGPVAELPRPRKPVRARVEPEEDPARARRNGQSRRIPEHTGDDGRASGSAARGTRAAKRAREDEADLEQPVQRGRARSPVIKRERDDPEEDHYEIEDDEDELEVPETAAEGSRSTQERQRRVAYTYEAGAEGAYFKRRRTYDGQAYEEDYAPHPNRHYIHPVA